MIHQLTEVLSSVNFFYMHAVLPQQQAREICTQWIEDLDGSELGSKLSEKDCGRMLGVLICSDGTVYKAFSGELLGSFVAEGFVPPVFDVDKMQAVLDESDSAIKAEPDKTVRSNLSRHYWHEIQKLYEFHCFDGSVKSLYDIFPNCQAGTGDCCAPRLLNTCFKNGKKPVSMAEFYYGNGPAVHKQFYNPCDERCKPILKYILGLDIVYLDSDIIVVNKPSGLLAIEGKTEFDCIASRVRNLYGAIAQPCVHRLDQATSGLMVLALTQHAHDTLCKDFEERKVYKEYVATVEGKILENSGTVSLPIRLDTDNRPHQIVDFENGKFAVTDWEKLVIYKLDGRDVTKLRLIPRTGRTHQLRAHCAYGLKHPIVNDSLYGSNPFNKSLMLTSVKLEFTHPVTNRIMSFELDDNGDKA